MRGMIFPIALLAFPGLLAMAVALFSSCGSYTCQSSNLILTGSRSGATKIEVTCDGATVATVDAARFDWPVCKVGELK